MAVAGWGSRIAASAAVTVNRATDAAFSLFELSENAFSAIRTSTSPVAN
jgi:hypothetical protein